ncbi:hypothetical protein SORBI_3002G035400 [Sorghum bicolor]|uniref:Uncharacterized protein n=1 Tax=Sorghum bicolor TaxID=4558 RepID=A0A1B6Q916_SORBI|nr:hypothetical protein SORBI_3002G035400 [Sorghum bicolor]
MVSAAARLGLRAPVLGARALLGAPALLRNPAIGAPALLRNPALGAPALLRAPVLFGAPALFRAPVTTNAADVAKKPTTKVAPDSANLIWLQRELTEVSASSAARFGALHREILSMSAQLKKAQADHDNTILQCQRDVCHVIWRSGIVGVSLFLITLNELVDM